MKLTSSEYKEIARDSLRGNWGKAVVSTVLAGCMGAFCSSLFFFLFFFSLLGLGLFFFEGIPDYFFRLLVGGTFLAVFYFFIGGVARFGYIDFNLALLDKRKAGPSMVFGRFSQIWTTVNMKLALFFCQIFLTLLFIIPGIFAHYSYAMVPYVLKEKPEYTVRNAMKMSKKIMRGHRWQLFWLRCSFLGWFFVSLITFGVGFFYLIPYKCAAEAVFYNEISGRADVYYGRNHKSTE